MPLPDDTGPVKRANSGSDEQDEALPPVSKQRWVLHLVLFLATCGTTFFAGGLFSGDPDTLFSPMSGLLFSVSIMGILVSHEMGHFVAARLHRVDASLPYFIPVPLPPIGTFGAVIRMRRPPRTKASLLDIGCAGPLAGMVVTLVVCFVGLELSEIRSFSSLPENTWMEGNSLLYMLLKKLAHPDLGPHQDVWLHPVAWAGWVGILVTSLNLLPAGQLDGGHVLYALVGPGLHGRVARAVHVVVFFMGLVGLACYLAMLHGPTMRVLEQMDLAGMVGRGSGMLVWLIWTILLKFVGHAHPPVVDTATSLDRGRLAVGGITLLVLIMTFTPVIGSPLNP